MNLDPDRILALSYVPARKRPAIAALWDLDLALGAVLAGGREPMISRIKLAWWREALEKLDRAPPPAEPVLQALAEHILPTGVTGAELAGMEEGWAVLLSDGPLTRQDLDRYAAGRGARLFALSARILGGEGAAGGEPWALVDLARHCGNGAEAEAAVTASCAYPAAKVPAPLRPLGMLDALARRDSEPGRPRWEAQGSPGRMVRMLRHRFSGR